MMGDPLTALRFYVTLLPGDAYLPPAQLAQIAVVSVGGFNEVTGLGATLETLAHPEGGRNDYVHQLPVRHTWDKIVLKRGLTHGSGLWNWYRAGLVGHLGARRDGTIVLLDSTGAPAVAWVFRAGLATKWSGPEFKASTSDLAVESLEITHHGIQQARVLGGGALL